MDDYGTFAMDVIRGHEESYVGTESRKAQDNRMMYECMYHSLSVEGMAKVNICQEVIYLLQYLFNMY